MLEIGSLVDGKYKILNKVGQGGMSVVYMAINEKANKTWAVKEVRKDGVLNFESVKQGLVAETNILKKLSHPNLPSIIDVIDTEDSFIIIMDYVQGNSLNKALEEYGAQPQGSHGKAKLFFRGALLQKRQLLRVGNPGLYPNTANFLHLLQQVIAKLA